MDAKLVRKSSFERLSKQQDKFRGYELANQIDKKFIVHKNGIVINRNSLTDLLADYLLMDIQELSRLTGNITPLAYKIIVLKTICELW